MAPVIWITISDPELPHVKAGLFNPVWPLRSRSNLQFQQ
jgi:hypothetical protein